MTHGCDYYLIIAHIRTHAKIFSDNKATDNEEGWYDDDDDNDDNNSNNWTQLYN